MTSEKETRDYYEGKEKCLFNYGIDDGKVYVVSTMPGVSSEIEGSGELKIEYVGIAKGVFRTWNAVTNDRILDLHPATRMKATNFINTTELALQLRISTGFRSNEEQELKNRYMMDLKNLDYEIEKCNSLFTFPISFLPK